MSNTQDTLAKLRSYSERLQEQLFNPNPDDPQYLENLQGIIEGLSEEAENIEVPDIKEEEIPVTVNDVLASIQELPGDTQVMFIDSDGNKYNLESIEKHDKLSAVIFDLDFISGGFDE